MKVVFYNYKPISLSPKTNSLNRKEHERMMEDLSEKSVSLLSYMEFCLEMYKSNNSDSDLYKNIFDKLSSENKKGLEFLKDQDEIQKIGKENNKEFGGVKKFISFYDKYKNDYPNWAKDNERFYQDCLKYIKGSGEFGLNENTENSSSSSKLLEYIKELTVYMNDNFMELKPYPKLIISKDSQYKDNILGATAFYDIDSQTVCVYIAGRHVIDICKSVLHELVHHHQYLSGVLTSEIKSKLSDPEYMANNPELLSLEADAYLSSALCFRQWRDSKRAAE